MLGIPKFFVPGATSGDQEELYATYARWCSRPVPAAMERVYSITFVHDGDEWTATVGQPLSGMERSKKRRRDNPAGRTLFLSDAAHVLAIFPGHPYLVVTNYRNRSACAFDLGEPFMAGRPTSVTYILMKAGR